jgi:hypothetical protein
MYDDLALRVIQTGVGFTQELAAKSITAIAIPVTVPFLPVRYAISRKQYSGGLVKAPHVKAPFQVTDAEGGKEIELGPKTHYTLRRLRPGFLYVFSEKDKGWRIYGIDENANLNYLEGYHLPNAGSASSNAPGDASDPDKHTPYDPLQHPSVNGALFIPPDAKVWIGYSDARWTHRTLDSHMDESVRKKHMRLFDPQAWKGNPKGTPHMAPLNETDQLVAEMYCDPSSKKPKGVPRACVDAKSFSFSQAPFCKLEMANLGVAAADLDGAALLAVEDPAGIAMDLARLMSTHFLEWTEEKDPNYKPPAVTIAGSCADDAFSQELTKVREQAKEKVLNQHRAILGGGPDVWGDPAVWNQYRNRPLTRAEKNYNEVARYKNGNNPNAPLSKTTVGDQIDYEIAQAQREATEKWRANHPDITDEDLKPNPNYMETKKTFKWTMLADKGIQQLRGEAIAVAEAKVYRQHKDHFGAISSIPVDDISSEIWMDYCAKPYVGPPFGAKEKREKIFRYAKSQRPDSDEPMSGLTVGDEIDYDLHMGRQEAIAKWSQKNLYDQEAHTAWQGKLADEHQKMDRERIVALAKAHVAWCESKRFVDYFNSVFDKVYEYADAGIGVAFTETLNLCYEGVQNKSQCFDHMLKWMHAAIDEQNLLVRAFLTNCQGAVEALKAGWSEDEIPWKAVLKELGKAYDPEQEGHLSAAATHGGGGGGEEPKPGNETSPDEAEPWVVPTLEKVERGNQEGEVYWRTLESQHAAKALLKRIPASPLEQQAAVGKLTATTSGVIAKAARDITEKDCTKIITLHPTEGVTPGLAAVHAGSGKWVGIYEMDLNSVTEVDRAVCAAIYHSLPEEVQRTIPIRQFGEPLRRFNSIARKTSRMTSSKPVGEAPVAGAEARPVRFVIMADIEGMESTPTHLLKLDPTKLANKRYVRVVGNRQVKFLEKNLSLGVIEEPAPDAGISAKALTAEDAKLAKKAEAVEAGAHAHGGHAPGKLSIGASILGAILSFVMAYEFNKEAGEASGEEREVLEWRSRASLVIGAACTGEAIFKILEHEPFGKAFMTAKIAGRLTQGFALVGIVGGLFLAGCDTAAYLNAKSKGEKSLASAFAMSIGVNAAIAAVSFTALVPAIILSWATPGTAVFGFATAMGSSPFFFIGVPALGFVLMVVGVYVAMAIASAESGAKKDHTLAHCCWGRGEHFNSFTLESHQFQAAMG